MDEEKFKKNLKEVNEKEIEKKKKKSLVYSILDGSAWSVMAGFGESYIAPFAIALKATNQQIAVLASFPQWIGSVLQLHSTKVLDRMKNRKKLINTSVLLQALNWLPIFFLPFFFKQYSVTFLIIFVCLYWIFGQFAAPAWNSLMGELVEEKSRGDYFGKRNKISGFVAFVSLFVAGFVLDKLSVVNIWLAFFVLFFIAMIARLISLHFLKLMYEPEYIVKKTDYFTFPDFVKRTGKTNFGRFVLYVGLMNFAVQIAGPFFVVYMLRDLHLSYISYTILISTAAASNFISMVYWGRNIDKFGAGNVLKACGILSAIIPIFWLFSSSMIYLIGVQIFAGFAWAGFNLAAFNFVFDSVKPGKRARCVAYQNVLNGSALFIGANIGGFLASSAFLPAMFGYQLKTIFFISAILRLLVAIFMVISIKEPRIIYKERGYALFWQLVAIQPVQGLVYQATHGMTASVKGLKYGIHMLDRRRKLKKKIFEPRRKFKL